MLDDTRSRIKVNKGEIGIPVILLDSYGISQFQCLFDSENLKPDELPTKLQLITPTIEANGQVWLQYKVIHPQEKLNKEKSK